MSTTIEALRNLGNKVNGETPTSNGVGNIINEIANNYEGSGGGTTYTAGNGIDITNDEISVDTDIIQEKLVSGTNIKTINNTSILGEGNITISGGGNESIDFTTSVGTVDFSANNGTVQFEVTGDNLTKIYAMATGTPAGYYNTDINVNFTFSNLVTAADGLIKFVPCGTTSNNLTENSGISSKMGYWTGVYTSYDNSNVLELNLYFTKHTATAVYCIIRWNKIAKIANLPINKELNFSGATQSGDDYTITLTLTDWNIATDPQNTITAKNTVLGTVYRYTLASSVTDTTGYVATYTKLVNTTTVSTIQIKRSWNNQVTAVFTSSTLS